jgi:hypothetical protein
MGEEEIPACDALDGEARAAEGGRMNDNVSHPAHYQGEYECIDLMREIYGDEAVRHFCICNAYKYRFRAGAKQGETAQSDIAKAEWYEAYVMEHLPMNEMLRSEKFIQSIRIGQRCKEYDKFEPEAET